MQQIVIVIQGDNFNFIPMDISYHKLQLPTNYAQLLLEREIEVKLSLQPFQNNLCNLLQLYSLGFEYYESIGSYKYRYFQQRMKEVFQQQEQENKKNQSFLSSLIKVQKGDNLCLISTEQLLKVDKKCLQQQRVSLLKQIQDRTSIKSTNQQIKTILLNGDYKAVDLYTRAKLEVDFQEKMLQQKLQMRHRKAVRNNSKKGYLKLNSTKTSLLSAQSKRGEYLQEIKQNIFEKFINQNEEDSQGNNGGLREDKDVFVYLKQVNSQ